MQDLDLALTSDQVHSLSEEMDACARRLDDLNVRFPNLASDVSKDGVAQWRARQIWIKDQKKTRSAVQQQPQAIDVKQLAIGLLADHGLEDVVDILLSKHRIELTSAQLVDLIGYEHYAPALRRDLGLLRENAVSYEQVAKLWTDLGRPALGGAEWNAKGVSALVG